MQDLKQMQLCHGPQNCVGSYAYLWSICGIPREQLLDFHGATSRPVSGRLSCFSCLRFLLDVHIALDTLKTDMKGIAF